MKDYQAWMEWLRAKAAPAHDLASDKAEHEFYDRLHAHFDRLAGEVERAMALVRKTP